MSTTTSAADCTVDRLTSGQAPSGVRGWLLLLCAMLTVVGPAIAIALMVIERPPVIGWVVTSASLLLGAWAGVQLWRVRPGAVALARRALLAGLLADVLTTLLQTTIAQPLFQPFFSSALLFQLQWQLLPSAIFFTLCLAYLNHSKRVQATYGAAA